MVVVTAFPANLQQIGASDRYVYVYVPTLKITSCHWISQISISVYIFFQHTETHSSQYGSRLAGSAAVYSRGLHRPPIPMGGCSPRLTGRAGWKVSLKPGYGYGQLTMAIKVSWRFNFLCGLLTNLHLFPPNLGGSARILDIVHLISAERHISRAAKRSS